MSMIPTKDEPGPFDAFERAQPGEPVFPLLGRDAAAPGAITEWCRLRRMQAIRKLEPGSDELTEELRQCADAEAIALAMDDYRRGDVSGDPAQRLADSGLMGETPEQRERHRQIAETVEHLRNAAYHTNEALEGLAKLGIDALAIHKANDRSGLPVFELCDALAAIKEADEAIAPKRRTTQSEAPLPEPIEPSFAEGCEHDWQPSPHHPNAERCTKCDASRGWSKPLSEIRT